MFQATSLSFISCSVQALELFRNFVVF